jgi:hypothetical protein
MKGINHRFWILTKTLCLALFLCLGFTPVSGQGPTGSVPEKELAASVSSTAPWTTDLIRKRPYLIYPGRNTSMTVLWQVFQSPAKATIEWGTTMSYGKGPVRVRESGTGVDEHQFIYTIQGLIPGIKYYYKVSNDGFSYTGSFTAAPPSNQTNLSFFGYGDTRPGYLELPTDHNAVLTELLNDMNKEPTQRQTVLVHLGDYVYHGLNEFLWDLQLFNPSSQLNSIYTTLSSLPFMGVLGNHEGYDAYAIDQKALNLQNIGRVFAKYFPYKYPNKKRFYYSFDYGPVHFTIVDTWSYETTNGEVKSQTIDATELNWIKQDLRSSKKPWKIAMLHTPLWECIAGNAGLQDQLTPVLKAGGVHLVLQGHHHYYSRAETEGPYSAMTWIVLGGGGAQPDPEAACVSETNKKSSIGIFNVFHFARFDISGNTLTGRVMDEKGTEIDSFQVTNASN